MISASFLTNVNNPAGDVEACFLLQILSSADLFYALFCCSSVVVVPPPPPPPPVASFSVLCQ